VPRPVGGEDEVAREHRDALAIHDRVAAPALDDQAKGRRGMAMGPGNLARHHDLLELIHQTRDWREGDRIVRDRVRLVWTEPTYGGRRWWFLCPRTGRKTTKLYLPNGGWHF